jgi:hypothetical protein
LRFNFLMARLPTSSDRRALSYLLREVPCRATVVPATPILAADRVEMSNPSTVGARRVFRRVAAVTQGAGFRFEGVVDLGPIFGGQK